MADRRWKQVERVGAGKYGEDRIALSGGNNRQAHTRSDTTARALGRRLFIEIKYGKAWLVFRRLWKATAKLAAQEGKAPTLLIYPRHGPFLAVIDADRHVALERVAELAAELCQHGEGYSRRRLAGRLQELGLLPSTWSEEGYPAIREASVPPAVQEAA